MTPLRKALLTASLCLAASLYNPAEAENTAPDPDSLRAAAVETTKAKQWPRSLEVWGRYLQERPEDEEAWRIHGYALRKLGRHEEATVSELRAEELKKSSDNAWKSRCRQQLLAGQFPVARASCEQAVAIEDDSISSLVNLGHTYLMEGNTETAYNWYRKAVQWIPDEETLIQGPLADFDIFLEQGWRIEESRQARAWFERLGKTWLQSLQLEIQVAQYIKENRYPLAIPAAQRSLALLEDGFGSEHPRVANKINKLAVLLEATGRYAEAEPLYRRHLEIEEKTLGPDSPDLLPVISNLGLLQEALGRYAEAEQLFRRMLKIAEKALGPDHPDVAVSSSHLAGPLVTTGRFAEAEPLLRRALEIDEKAHGPEHPSTAAGLYNLAGLLCDTGRTAEAESLYRRALAILDKPHGSSDDYYSLYYAPEYLTLSPALKNLARIYEASGRYLEAEPLIRRALAIQEKALDPDHPHVASSLSVLAALFHATGRYAEAEPLLRRALAIDEKALGPEHPSTAASQHNLAVLLNSTNRSAEAEPLLLRAYRISLLASDAELAWTIPSSLREHYTTPHPELAIYYGKQSINTLQAIRAGNTGLDAATQKSFLGKHEDNYTALADLLFSQGRLMEGQQVLAMLKESELHDFMQRNANDDPRKTQAGFTGREKPWAERYQQISTQLASLGRENEALRQRLKFGLTPEEQARKTVLDADLKVARQAYDDYVAALMRDLGQNAGENRQQELGEKNLETLRALQSTLKDLGHGAVTVHYLMADKRLWILLTTPSIQLSRQIAISAVDLNRKIGQYREAIARRDPQIKEQGKALYDLLIAPIEEDLKQAQAQTLMLSLDGGLRYLPIAALHDGQHYLGERYRLALYTEAAKANLKDKPQAAWHLAGFGLSEAVAGFTPLTAVKAELEGIVRDSLEGQIKLDQGFTAQSFKTGLDQEPPVVHLASHFVFKPGTEADSFLLLGDGSKLSLQALKDGYEFHNTDLLTLSACDTAVGGGKDENGREVEGFGALAQKQGAKGVIATLWPVADQSTGQFMQLFYGYRQQQPGITKAEALQKAQRAFIEGRVGQALADVSRGATRKDAQTTAAPVTTTDHPYYWAPFILMGNWL